MPVITIIVIAVGLAMDAFAVSIVSGATFRELKIRHALRIALFFGGFQALMPLVGSLAGLTLKQYVASYDHWVAFILLAAVGAKMIYESFKIEPADRVHDPSNLLTLLVLSVATSIDALAIGVTLSLITSSIAAAAGIIGLVTFVLSYLGVAVGKKFGHFFEKKIEIAGGLVLIAIGVKILVEHLLF
ncbi:MAG: manganese efflux pump [Phycisphaerales bacterium]|nr:MAG: manganese efflux pump [Phycisphaerales bacterium]